MMEIESLLAPIGGDSPVGPNLRLGAGDTTLSDIEELRREEDPEVDPSGQGKDADWFGLVSACESALAEKSKDLQLAAYLAAGWTRTEGFPGLLAGLQLVRGLVEQYWDNVHPGWEPEDNEIIEPIRGRWISWIGTSRDFLNAVRSVSITSGPGIEARGWGDYEGSERVDDASILADQTQVRELLDSGLIGGDTWRSLMGGTSPERLIGITETLAECEAELRQLDDACRERFQEDEPSLVDLSQMLDACRTHIDGFLEGTLPEGGAGEEAGGDGESTGGLASAGGAATTAGGGGPAGPIGTRDEAYRRLREVAEYLRRTEPHSPVAALLERAVNWGGLSFQELVIDVLKHQDDAREQIFETLGIAAPDDDEM